MSRQSGLYRRGCGGFFNFRYCDAAGIWREKSTGYTDRKSARAFKDEFDKALADGELPTERAEWTVRAACTVWVENHVLRSTKARSNERSSLRILLRSFLADKKLKDVKHDDLRRYQRERSATVENRPINIELNLLVRTLREANLWRPALAKNFKRLSEPESQIGRALTPEELTRLETVASSNDAWYVCYCAELLASNGGLRGGEIKKLRLGAIDLERRRLTVARQATKSNAGARLVELNENALWAVSKLYERAQLLGSTSPDHYLLPADLSRHTRKNDPLRGIGFDPTHHQISWNSAWQSLRKAAGLERVRFHDLRHTFVSSMAENGVPLPVLQSLVGHMGPAITRHYTHISNSAARRAVELLDRNRGRFVDSFVDASVETENSRPN